MTVLNIYLFDLIQFISFFCFVFICLHSVKWFIRQWVARSMASHLRIILNHRFPCLSYLPVNLLLISIFIYTQRFSKSRSLKLHFGFYFSFCFFVFSFFWTWLETFDWVRSIYAFENASDFYYDWHGFKFPHFV